jgi:hypothetical protein
MKKVTIYSTSEFFGDVTKVEAILVEIGRRDYAQYRNAPYVIFIPKGKQKQFIKRALEYAYLLVIEGWNHPPPFDMMTPLTDDGTGTGTKTQQSRYPSFDDRYKTEFDELMNPYLEKQTVILDVRKTAGREVVNEFTNNNQGAAQTNPA